jgi:Neuraminidase (sialidase)
VEYCRQPEYKEYKREYDVKYHAKKNYGEYWEAAILLNELENEIDNRTARKENKLYNKSTSKRKRSWQKALKQTLRNLQPLT